MPQESQTRYHGLDALRGLAMMLGIVLHAALPYVEPYTWDDFSTYWPQDSDASFVIWGSFVLLTMFSASDWMPDKGVLRSWLMLAINSFFA